jgi:large subunit ribosomal protein L25
MTEEFKLEATKREDLGKGASRRLRRENKIPAIMYGHKKEAKSITLDMHTINKYEKHEAFYTKLLKLTLDKKNYNVLVKDMQRHPYKPVILHIDLQEVGAKDIITTKVPLHFINEEKIQKLGARLIHNFTEIEIQCPATALPEYIEVDLAEIQIGQTYHLSDLKVGKDIKIVLLINDKDQPLVSAQAAKSQADDEDDASADETPAADDKAEAKKDEK